MFDQINKTKNESDEVLRWVHWKYEMSWFVQKLQVNYVNFGWSCFYKGPKPLLIGIVWQYRENLEKVIKYIIFCKNEQNKYFCNFYVN